MSEKSGDYKASFLVVERDDAILIPEDSVPGFTSVLLEFGDGVTLGQIEESDVVLLENQNTLRFERCTPGDWDSKYTQWERAGWDPIGFESVRLYSTYEEYQKIC